MTSAPAGTPDPAPGEAPELVEQMPEQTRSAILAHPAVARVREALTAVHVTTEIVVLDGAARTAAQAAAYLGVLTAQIANSLVFAVTVQGTERPDSASADPEPLLILTSGAHRVDTSKVADLLELDTVDMASADLVRGATGFVIGGVAPVGHVRLVGCRRADPRQPGVDGARRRLAVPATRARSVGIRDRRRGHAAGQG